VVVPESLQKLIPPYVQRVRVRVTVTVPPRTCCTDQLVRCHGHALLLCKLSQLQLLYLSQLVVCIHRIR
jgi:hypothetical protein